MTGRPTDHRNIDLTQLHLDVVRGRAGGQVIWQPRILAWRSDRAFRREPLPAPVTGTTPAGMYRVLGVSNRIYGFGDCIREVEHPDVRVTKRDIGRTEYEVLIETPAGCQRAVYRRSPNNPWHEPIKWPVSDAAEMKVAGWRERNRTFQWDPGRYDELSAEWAGLGAPTLCVPRTTIQKLLIETMGTEGTIYALADDPGGCEAYFEAIEQASDRFIEVVCASPVEVVNFGDNIDARVTSPALFRKYVLPVYQRRCERLHAAGKFVHSHWDGAVGPLLGLARESGLDGIEAITPRPQGDVTLEQTKAALGDMFLLDGIPAIFFDDTYSEQQLVDCARRCIELFAPRLVLGISDEISSTGDIRRVDLVTRVVDDYNAAL